MRMAFGGGILLSAGILLVAAKVEPVPAAIALAARVWPILLFVAAITVVTDLAAAAGVFTVIAVRMTRWGAGRAWLLWGLVCLLCTLTTIFFSLDATAVLITPIVVRVVRRAGLPVMPFALTTIWLANTASLFLPVSNLTNLLAQRAGSGGVAAFVAVSWLPATVAVLVPVAFLGFLFRRDLSARFTPGVARRPIDRVSFRIGVVVLGGLLPALVSGVPVWIPASAAALILIAVFTVRQPSVLHPTMVPWSLLVFAGGLFLVLDAAHQSGLGAVLAGVTGGGVAGLFRVAGLGALGANTVNNLPAYLAIAPAVAGHPVRVMALLIGTNCGPLVTPWASLATLLWHRRLATLGVHVRWGRYMLVGLLGAPLTVGCAVGALALMP
jgi:Na+/H+ antiporter NhaD/arsenite permease-like protein